VYRVSEEVTPPALCSAWVHVEAHEDVWGQGLSGRWHISVGASRANVFIVRVGAACLWGWAWPGRSALRVLSRLRGRAGKQQSSGGCHSGQLGVNSSDR
jgi:hypothetical protein